MATLLDPRYKDRYFDRENKQSALDMLKATVDKLETCSSASESAERTTEPELGEGDGDVEPEETDDRPQKKAMRSS